MYLPSSLKTIAREAFYDCRSLEQVTYNGTKDNFNNITFDTDYNDVIVEALNNQNNRRFIYKATGIYNYIDEFGNTKSIDGSNENKYPPELLHAMKRKHEERIALATSITPNKQSIIVIYTSSVGKQKPSIDYRDAVDAMFPTFYPTADSPIDLSTNTPFNDNEECYWATEKMALDRNYRDKVSCLLANGYPNISIFAIAPQPLLVYLGTLLGDIHKISVFQKHREPNTWRWLDMESNNAFILNEPPSKNGRPILVFAISSQNIEKRIKNLYNKDESIWIIRCKEPNNDMLISPKQLSEYRALVRKVMDDINKTSSNDEIRIHMSMPIACAIELGRIRMPKADKSWMLFDYHRDTDKELETITIQ